MKAVIQIIVCGWYYSQDTLINQLKELNQENENVNVFWSCHKEPPQIIKDNFDYKIFANIGLHMGAYQQALDHLKLDNDTVLFFMHDDIILKNTAFVNLCLIQLKSKKFIGNSFSYPTQIDPSEETSLEGINLYHLSSDDNRFMFSDELPIYCLTIRSSFICTLYSYLKDIGEFDIAEELPQVDNLCDCLDSLFIYKINRFFGPNSIGYLSTKVLDSSFMYELDENELNKHYKYGN